MTDFIIENVPLTKSWLADVIEKKVGARPSVGTNTTLDNSELGYMSLIRKVDLLFDGEQEEHRDDLPKHVVLKVVNCAKGLSAIEGAVGEDVTQKEELSMENIMHDTECEYYTMFSKQSVKPLKIPIIYSCIKSTEIGDDIGSPVIVMELFPNCRVYDLCDGFNETQLYKIVDELVNLHTFSLTTSDWKDIKEHERKEEMFQFYSSMIRTIALKLSEEPGLESIKTFLENTYEKNPNFMFERADSYLTDENPFSVICHGDLWTPQILWDSEDNLAGIIDWQIAHRGSPFEDFQHVLSTCTSVENRTKLTKPLMDYYYQQLTERLQEKGFKMPWTREMIDEEYKRSLLESCAKTIFSNGFWANTPILQETPRKMSAEGKRRKMSSQTDGKPNIPRIVESFGRCRSFVEETIQAYNWK